MRIKHITHHPAAYAAIIEIHDYPRSRCEIPDSSTTDEMTAALQAWKKRVDASRRVNAERRAAGPPEPRNISHLKAMIGQTIPDEPALESE